MPRESKSAKQKRAMEICTALQAEYPEATTALDWTTPWELLAATILSAQCTDEKVNEVTADLFKKYPDVRAFAAADPTELEQAIHSTGFFRNKTKSLMGAARVLLEQFDGEVPRSMAEMLTLPGVQRKTANVVLGTAYGMNEGIVVDTHMSRLAVRMGLSPRQTTKSVNTDKIERDLMELVPREHWMSFSHSMVWHGRRVCTARKPHCAECVITGLCPKIGVESPAG